jgi:hypothetical protein
MAKQKTRNPYAGMLSRPEYQPRVVISEKEKKKTQDGWNRKAKHKKVFQLGDTVEFDGKEAIVKNPNGPDDMIGIAVDGAYTLVQADTLSMLEETIQKMRNLTEMLYVENTAGMRIPISKEEEEVLNKVAGGVDKSSLDEREQEVARLMVTRGILKREKRNGKIVLSQDKEKLRR